MKNKKDQKLSVIKEPDPEEKEDQDIIEHLKEEKIITDSLYNAVIGQQFELE